MLSQQRTCSLELQIHWHALTPREKDETAGKLGPFLSLANQCHPLVLETFLAPSICLDSWGEELRNLFPAVWSPRRAYDSFLGYALNQRTKFLETKDGRPAKYAATYLRVLYNLCELLDAGTCTICIAETPMGPPSFERKRSRFAPER